MSSVNKVLLIGYLGQDPDVKMFNNGGMLVNLSMATSQRFTDKVTGEKRENTQWHRVVVRSEYAAKFCKAYLRKGDRVYVEGELQTRKWQTNDGQDRYVTEVVVAGFRGQVVSLSERRSDGGGVENSAVPVAEAATESGLIDDEIPF